MGRPDTACTKGKRLFQFCYCVRCMGIPPKPPAPPERS
jgi:hypothetical protein